MYSPSFGADLAKIEILAEIVGIGRRLEERKIVNFLDGRQLQGSVNAEADRQARHEEKRGAAEFLLERRKYEQGRRPVHIGIGPQGRDGKNFRADEQKAV